MAIVGERLRGARLQCKQKTWSEMIKGAIQHKGFALVDVLASVTYNKDNT